MADNPIKSESYSDRISAMTEIQGTFARKKPAAYVVSALWPDGGGASHVEGSKEQIQLLLFEAMCSAMIRDGALDDEGRRALGKKFVEMMGWNPQTINYDSYQAERVEVLSDTTMTDPAPLPEEDIQWPEDLGDIGMEASNEPG